MSIFLGALAITSSGIDQWIRTFGTLSPKDARISVSLAILLLFLGGSIPILLGSTAHKIKIVPSDVTNEASFYLIAYSLDTGSDISRFLLLVTFACVVLTTVDTYLITLQQLYYEVTIRIRASTHRTYILEYLSKWKQVRLISSLFLLAALATSFGVEREQVFSLGVLLLSLPVLWSPSIMLEALSNRFPIVRRRVAANTHVLGFLLGSLMLPVAFLGLSSAGIYTDQRLYVIVGATASVSLVAYALSLIFSLYTNRNRG